MGYRFRGGEPIEFVPRTLSSAPGTTLRTSSMPYAYGCIQIPGGLEPIVLHRDAVSAGGYFTLGVVISADMDRIGQMQPNTRTRFVQVDMPTALAARAARRARLSALRTALD